MDQVSLVYESIKKGSGVLIACNNHLYKRVKTIGDVKYYKCVQIGCDGSVKQTGSTLTAGVCTRNFVITCKNTLYQKSSF